MLRINPNYLSEADLLAEFYHQCRLKGLTLRMEVSLPSKVHQRSKKTRVDIAVILGNRIIALVEGKTPGKVTGKNSRQTRAYAEIEKEHGIPVFWLNRYDQINGLIEKLRLILLGRGGVT
jgi:hypothetical protein